MLYPKKLKQGDRVAVVAPSGGLPEVFPIPFDHGLRRLRDEFGLVTVELPTTRRMNATPQERAADITAAFADPSIKALVAAIGGDDQITVIPHLDDEVIRRNPKPFFGYSDNTNLLAHLWRLGIVGYHGGSVMVQFGRGGAMHPITKASLHAAFFTSGPYELTESYEYGDVEQDWEDPEFVNGAPLMTECGGWIWHNADRVVEGVTWGGNLEILHWMLAADRDVAAPQTYTGMVLFIETSEEMPSAAEVFRMLRNLGERGILGRFAAVVCGRAKAWSFEHRNGPEEKARYAREQREAILRALTVYAPEALAVFDVDLGHTDPQVVIPYGGRMRLDGPARKITVDY
ncbi:S66 peptidase family protein [Herbidospora daliensis]|uniref:S66 peptidase family protein n=1 Tax=Herbidospora daliensis TaxID=295585 RepID=UPI000785AF33|nr:S66 peptidase family protein [Herbidospora daliensis]